MTRRMMAGDPLENEIEQPLRSGEFISDCACFSLASGFEEAAAKMPALFPADSKTCGETAATPNCTGYPGSVDVLHWVYNLYTTTPFSPSNSCSNINDCKALFAGTSQATPHVAGAVALMLSKNSSLTVPQITQILNSTADDIGDARQGHAQNRARIHIMLNGG